MSGEPSYKKAFYWAVSLHCILFISLWLEPSHKTPVLDIQATKSQDKIITKKKSEIVKAVSVNQKDLDEVVNKIKAEKAHKRQLEIQRKNHLNQQLLKAQKTRKLEQARIRKLKQEANKLALLQKRERLAEKQRLKALKEKQINEQKKLEEIQNRQALLKKQEEARRNEALRKKREAQAKKEMARKEALRKQLEKEKAAKEAAKNARIAGEVNKYKALIINAISRHWILPDNVNGELSSQFRIRLAPDGMVLEVNLTKGSGDPILDRSARTAIYKASPLPVPKDREAFNVFRDIRLTVRPEQVRG